MRPVWLITGLLLWTAAGVSLYSMWNRTAQSSAGSPSTESDPTGGAAVLVKPGSDPDAEDDAEPGIVKPAEAKPAWSEAGIDDFVLTDRSGEAVSKNDLRGTPWIASFIFTRCAGPCPRVTEAMKTLQRRYEGRDVRFVTFTVDPKNDTPEVLAKFADFWDADPERWFFLTGDRDAIYRLINTSFLMPVMESPDPEPGWEVIHTTNVCLVSPTGRVVGKYNSLSDTEVALMRRDLDGMLDQLAASSTDDSDAPDGGVE